ncbi:hypothetical protein LXL04_033550 [Taraxacum kok-saghyz]
MHRDHPRERPPGREAGPGQGSHRKAVIDTATAPIQLRSVSAPPLPHVRPSIDDLLHLRIPSLSRRHPPGHQHQRFLLQRRPPIGIDFAFEIDFATCQFEIDFASSEFEIDFATCEPEHYYLNLKSVFLPVNLLTSQIGLYASEFGSLPVSIYMLQEIDRMYLLFICFDLYGSLSYQITVMPSRTGYHNMYKEYRDTTLNGSIEQMCKRESTKQFHNCKIKFPLVFKKVRPPTRKLKTTYKAHRGQKQRYPPRPRLIPA